MGRAAELKALTEVLEDPTNQDKTTQEICHLLIDALDQMRSRTHRLAVVGQISPGMPGDGGPVHTVVLGPFSSRTGLSSPLSLIHAAAGGSAARDAGEGLAWDSKTGTGRGRFMLAPAFLRPRDAWDFFRGEKSLIEEAPHIEESIARWQPGLWTDEVGLQPACCCAATRPGHVIYASTGEVADISCPVHPQQGEES